MDMGMIIYFAKVGLSALILAAALGVIAAVFDFIYVRLPDKYEAFAYIPYALFIGLASLSGIVAAIMGIVAAIMYGVTIL